MSVVQYRPHIDGLRALAVSSVVLYHLNPSLLPGGFLGVDVFFVISGYLISLIVFREQENGGFSFINFYSRRIRRLFPALATVISAVIVFGAFTLFADEYERLGKNAASAIIFLLNFRLMDEAGYFDITSHAKPLLHLWSLSVEEQFYLVWPMLLVVFRYFRLPFGLIIILLIIGSFLYSLRIAEQNLDALYFHPVARCWELLSGAALAYYHHCGRLNSANSVFTKLDHTVVRHMLSLIGLVLMLASFLLWESRLVNPGKFTIFPMLGAIAVIASGGMAYGSRLLSLKPLIWIGLISYPLYLWHWPVLSYIRIMESGAPSSMMLWAGAGSSVLLALMTYRFIEQPLRRPSRIRSKLIGLGIAMTALFVASRAVVASHGLPDRSAVQYVKAAEPQMKREPRQDESCLGLFPEGKAPVYCRQHNPGEHMLAIIGDSHAHVLFPGVSSLAADKGYGTLLLANSGCPPFEGAVTGRNANEKKRCAASIETILSTIQRDRRIEFVVIASRGPQYIDGKGFGPVEANYNYPPISSKASIQASDEYSPSEAFSQGLSTSIMRLHERGLRVAYLLQVPELGVPARDCLMRPLLLTKKNSGCEVPYNVYQERMRPYRLLIDEIRATRNFLAVIDPEPFFCNGVICSGYRNRQLLYADDNHLSVLGSNYLAPAILQAINLQKSSAITASYRSERPVNE